MKQALLLTVASAVSAIATSLWVQPSTRPNEQPASPARDTVSIDRHESQRLAESHVIDLPEDGHTWHTILILRPDWRTTAAETRAESMFHSEPMLVSLKRQTHWHLITTDQVEFQPFRPLVSTTPCLVVERANGEVVYRESGPDLGRRPHALTHAIGQEIQRHCPDGRCLPLHPVPDRNPDRDEPDEIPAVLREPERSRDKPLPLGAIASALAGLAGGVAAHWRKYG